MIENIQHDYFIWEEKNSTEQKTNYENKIANEDCGFITEIKNDSTLKDWKDITEPKLRKKMRNEAYYESNKEKINKRHKNYNQNNKEKQKAYHKAYREDNKEKLKVKYKAYREVNKDKAKYWQKNNLDKHRVYNKKWRESNKDRMSVKRRNYSKNRMKTDIQFKLSHALRRRLHSALKNNQKVGSAVKDLGCTIEELKSYLESKFQTGMNWDNWSNDGWHIDHIKPLASFDLTDRKQLLEACHYTNLQPLWAIDNFIKNDKIVTTI